MISPPLRAIAVLTISLLAPLSLHAQLQWDPGLTPASPSGGAGTWDSTTANWSNGTTNTTWNNGTAVLGGTAPGRITVSGTQTITGISVSVAAPTAYIITGGGLSFEGATSIAVGGEQANRTLLISTPLSGEGSLSLTNSATTSVNLSLLLTGVNSYSGGTTLNGGVNLTLNDDRSLGLSSTAVRVQSSSLSSNASLRFEAGNTATARDFVLNGGIDLALQSYSSDGPTTFTGVFSGNGSLRLQSTNNGGTMVFSGHSTYSGTTVITDADVIWGADNVFPDTPLTITTGTSLTLGGFSEQFDTLKVQVSGNTFIDFATGASSLEFANSSTESWSGTGQINLTNFVTGTDILRFGTDANGLTATQLSRLVFDGATAAQIDSQGFVTPLSAVPEPAAAATVMGLLVLGGTALGRRPRVTDPISARRA